MIDVSLFIYFIFLLLQYFCIFLSLLFSVAGGFLPAHSGASLVCCMIFDGFLLFLLGWFLKMYHIYKSTSILCSFLWFGDVMACFVVCFSDDYLFFVF